MYKTPIDLAIVEFGGVTKLAKALKISKANVSKWRSYQNRYGDKGLIPTWAMAELLKISKKREYKISAEDLIFGREE